jgi:hypothetical protein
MPVAAAVKRIDRGGVMLADALESGKPGAVDAALAQYAGIDPSVALLALKFIGERHEQARRPSPSATSRINLPCRVRRSRSRAHRSHRSSAASIGKLAAGDPDPEPEPPTTRHTATIGGVP